MTIVRTVLLLSACSFSLFCLPGCSSDEEPTEPAIVDDGPQEPEQVSFADWERPENCELGTMPVIGETECQRVGSACPAGDWPAAIPEADQVIYVQPGAEGDGTSKTSAIGKISDAVEMAEDGAVIVLSKGTHLDNVVIEKSLSIIGACPVGTTVRGKVSMGAIVSNLNADLTMNEPVNNAGEVFAVFYLRGESNVAIKDIMITGDNVGIAINGSESLNVELDSLVLNELMSSAIYIQEKHAQVTSYSITIEKTQTQQDLDQGKGIRVNGGAMTVERSFFNANYFAGIACDSKLLGSEYTNLHVTNSVFIDGKPSPAGSRVSGINGQGLMAYKCDMTVTKVFIDNNSYYGIGMFNEHESPTILTVTDAVIRNTKPTPELRTSDLFPWAESEAGIGLFLFGGEAYVNRVLLENNSTADILVMESAFPCNPTTMGSCEKTYAVLENITSKSVKMDTTGHFGSGIVVMDGAEALVSKASFDKTYTAGVMVVDAMRRNGSGDTLALFTDVSVSNVEAGEAGDEASGGETFGDGIVVANGAMASFNRFKVSNVERVGVLLNGKYDWQAIEDNFGKRDQVSKAAVERSKKDKQGKRDSVLSFGSVEKAKIGINNQMMTEELGKKDSVEELSNGVSTSETESSYSTDAIAIPTFSVLNKEFMEAVFGASLDEQAQ